jgi:hypothetical protein
MPRVPVECSRGKVIYPRSKRGQEKKEVFLNTSIPNVSKLVLSSQANPMPEKNFSFDCVKLNECSVEKIQSPARIWQISPNLKMSLHRL